MVCSAFNPHSSRSHENARPLLRLSAIDYSLAVERMEPPGVNFSAKLRAIKSHSLRRPAKDHVGHEQDVALIILLKSGLGKVADVFESLVLCPSADRYLSTVRFGSQTSER